MGGAGNRRQGIPEVIACLRPASYIGDFLMPNLISSGNGESSGRAVQDVYNASAIDHWVAEILVWHTDGQIGVTVAVEIAGG